MAKKTHLKVRMVQRANQIVPLFIMLKNLRRVKRQIN